MKLDEVQEKARDQFSKQSHRYGRGHILENVDDIRAALEALPLPPRARALDIACGAGHTGLYLAGLGHDVTLADIAAPMLARAREAAEKKGLSVRTNQHAAEELPYPDGAFDLVACRVAAHHFSSPESFFRESARVLRPGGWFLLIDGSAPDGNPEAEEWLHAVEIAHDPSHRRLLTPGAARRLCEQSGLAVRRLTLSPFKMPDLEWYFETSDTTPENRRRLYELVKTASPAIRSLFQLGEEDGKIVWFWRRMALVAEKSEKKPHV